MKSIEDSCGQPSKLSIGIEDMLTVNRVAIEVVSSLTPSNVIMPLSLARAIEPSDALILVMRG